MLLPLLLACSPPPGADSPVAGSMRLHAEGTLIADDEGAPVQLRGVNLGAWIFHETWMSSVDWPTWGRFRLVAQEGGYGAQVDVALQQTGETDDLDALEAALADQIGAAPAAAVGTAAGGGEAAAR